jgi:hypothetical protein
MVNMNGDIINEALEALEVLGSTLAFRGLEASLVVIGGGNLIYAGLVRRTVTKDLDVVGQLRDGRVEPITKMPQPLAQAILDVARQLDLAPDWINTGPSALLTKGLPEGFVARLEREEFSGALTVWFAGRLDAIATKIYAAANPNPGDPNTGRHLQDLVDLAPTGVELAFGRAWMATWADGDLLAAADDVIGRLS